MSELTSSNINANDLDEETRNKLKGDTIGDTLYSESFVIKTLLQLSDLKWSDDIEQDLCFLWDMTIEKEVCKYLFELSFPSLACSAVERYEEERFVEIIIGILANILLVNCDCDKTITDDEIKSIFNQLNTDDSAILIQIMRFIEAIAYNMPNRVIIIDKEVLEKILFILKYSQNFDLISHAMQALVRLTEDFKLGEMEVDNTLYEAVVQGFDTIFTVEANNFEIEIDTEETSKIVKTFLNLISNMCAYVDKYHHENGIPTCINNCPKLNVTICRILNHFSEEQYLFPLSKDFNEYIVAFQSVVTTRDVTIVEDLNNAFFFSIFHSLCKILYLLHRCKSEVLDSFNLVLELIGDLFYLVDQNVILCELKKLQYRRAIVVLNSLKEISRTFTFDISVKLRFLYSELK